MQIPEIQDREPHQKALEKIAEMTKVIRHLHKHYAQSLSAWVRFSRGDALYFFDLKGHPVAREILSSISRSFEKISDIERRVKLMREDCDAATKLVSDSCSQFDQVLTVPACS